MLIVLLLLFLLLYQFYVGIHIADQTVEPSPLRQEVVGHGQRVGLVAAAPLLRARPVRCRQGTRDHDETASRAAGRRGITASSAFGFQILHLILLLRHIESVSLELKAEATRSPLYTSCMAARWPWLVLIIAATVAVLACRRSS